MFVLWLALTDRFTKLFQTVNLADLSKGHRLRVSIWLVITQSRNTWLPWKVQFYPGSFAPSL